MYTSRISGLGHFVPDNIVTNDDLSKLMDTNDEWVQERTGIKERRWIEKGSSETSASMGAKAAKIAIEKAGIDKKLTSHVARHSFAEIARTKGVPLYDISKALGHSSLAITEQYLSSFDENSLKNAMEKIFE